MATHLSGKPLVKKFFKIDFTEADFLVMKNKKFIEELLPDYPIILDLLPHEAQRVVEKVHPFTEPALHILKKQGFNYSGLVGIFEPGPVISAKVKEIKTVKDSSTAKIAHIEKNLQGKGNFLIATTDPADFKATLGSISIENKELKIDEESSKILGTKIGTEIRFVPLD